LEVLVDGRPRRARMLTSTPTATPGWALSHGAKRGRRSWAV